MNIAGNLENTAFLSPDRIAVIESDTQISYATLNRDSGQIAAALVDRGVTPGDHVALCAPNSYEWRAFYFGVLKAGAVAVTFSSLLTGDELTKIMANGSLPSLSPTKGLSLIRWVLKPI